MTRATSRRPSPAMVVALAALVVALGGTAIAATKLVSGDKLIAKGSLSGNRLRKHTLTGTQINLKKLGTVPAAAFATNATNATNAANATDATNAANATNATTAAKLTPHGAFAALALGTGWVANSSTLAPGYYLDREGFVHLQGAVSLASGTSTIIGTLPAGDRPAGTATEGSLFPVATAAGLNFATGQVDILGNGQIIITSVSLGIGGVVSLEGITFAQGN